MRRFKSYLLILIALWLPVQAAAAVTMSFCRHAPEPAVIEATHCHEHGVEPVVVIDLDCDNCSMCHLSCAGFLLATGEAMSPLAASILVPKLQAALASHTPEPPQQPPRR